MAARGKNSAMNPTFRPTLFLFFEVSAVGTRDPSIRIMYSSKKKPPCDATLRLSYPTVDIVTLLQSTSARLPAGL